MDIRIKDLPLNTTPTKTLLIPTDLATAQASTIEQIVLVGRPTASQAEAEAGTEPVKAMTPLTTAQAIAVLAASPAQGALASTAVQPVDARALSFSNKISMLDIAPYDNSHRVNVVVSQNTADDYASVNLNRSSGVTGGTDFSINSTLRLQNTVYNSDAYNASTNPLGKGSGYDGKPYEWGMGILLLNGRNYLSGGYRGQNGAAYFSAKKAVANAGGTWGINSFAFDYPGLSNPTTLTTAAEFDVHADGTDVNNVRVGVSSFIKSTQTVDGAPSGYGEGSYGFYASADGNVSSGTWFSKWKTGYYAAGPMNIAYDAADTSNPFATTPYTTPIALRMNSNQKIAFDPDNKHSLRYANSGSKLVWSADEGGGASDTFAVDGYGNFIFGAGTPTVQTDYVWGRVAGITNAAFEVTGGSGGLRFSANSTATIVESESTQPIIFKINNVEIFRVTSAGITMAPGKVVS